MTFTDIVNQVLARTRQTSTEAATRIGVEVNERYRRVTSAIGLPTARRVEVSANTAANNPEVTFTAEKLLSVFDLNSGNRRVLEERTFDEWRNANTWAPASGLPTSFAVSRMGASTVTIVLDPVPTSIFALKADAIANLSDLSGTDVPTFAADYHDVLLHGALADEWLQLKQNELARHEDVLYEGRLSDLRMFIAKSAYLAICQGGRGGLDRGAYWPGYLIPRFWR